MSEALFDLDAMTAAVTHPSFKLNGRTYQGRLMGYSDYLTWTRELTTLATRKSQSNDEAELYRVLRGALSAMQFDQDAQDALLAAPRPLAQKVLNGFFKLHRLEEDVVEAGEATVE